jgi:hypothetical protein
MENIKEYNDFINEAKIQEKEGISPAIYKDLEQYFANSKSPSPSLKGAQAYLAKVKEGWKLSAEDFAEAKKEFKK